MAERATAERVASDMKPPNYRSAVQRLRTIKAKKERVAGINGEISGIYDTVEGFKVNKKAAKIFIALDGLEPDEQQDIFRSLTGLIGAAGWQMGDLVDQAEGAAAGNIVTPQFGRRKAAQDDDSAASAGDDDEGEGGDDIDSVAAEVAAPAAEPADGEQPKRLTPAQARARAKEHFEKGSAPPPSTAPAGEEPYTGDNSDLAGGADE